LIVIDTINRYGKAVDKGAGEEAMSNNKAKDERSKGRALKELE
jgi:hypothetical protein